MSKLTENTTLYKIILIQRHGDKLIKQLELFDKLIDSTAVDKRYVSLKINT